MYTGHGSAIYYFITLKIHRVLLHKFSSTNGNKITVKMGDDY